MSSEGNACGKSKTTLGGWHRSDLEEDFDDTKDFVYLYNKV